jgi:hypothetical protein
MTHRLFWREYITRGNGEPYLTRTHLFKCPWFSVFLHEFVGGDDPCQHDHPWNFVSILLKGGYTEWTPAPEDEGKYPDPTREVGVWYGPGSFLYRPAAWTHRVDIGKQKRVVSLVIHGTKIRNWGFWTKLQGWLHHSKYSYHKHCA